MKINLSLTETKNYTATNEDGHTVKYSANGMGVRPMQSVLMAAAACSSFDLENILTKMKQVFSNIEVDATAERDPDNQPSLFVSIHLHYKVYGDIKESKVKRACKLALDYCSVSKILEKSAEVSHSFEVVNPK